MPSDHYFTYCWCSFCLQTDVVAVPSRVGAAHVRACVRIDDDAVDSTDTHRVIVIHAYVVAAVLEFVEHIFVETRFETDPRTVKGPAEPRGLDGRLDIHIEVDEFCDHL